MSIVLSSSLPLFLSPFFPLPLSLPSLPFPFPFLFPSLPVVRVNLLLFHPRAQVVHPASQGTVSPSCVILGTSPALMVGKWLMSWRSLLTTVLDRGYSPWRLIPRWNWTQLASGRSCSGGAREVRFSCSLYILCRLKEQERFLVFLTGGTQTLSGLSFIQQEH